MEGTAGQAAFDPQLLTSLWVYAYSRGVGSAREIARLCEYHPAYQWLTGLEAVNYHSLSDFRTRHQEALSQLFTEVLGAAQPRRPDYSGAGDAGRDQDQSLCGG